MEALSGDITSMAPSHPQDFSAGSVSNAPVKAGKSMPIPASNPHESAAAPQPDDQPAAEDPAAPPPDRAPASTDGPDLDSLANKFADDSSANPQLDALADKFADTPPAPAPHPPVAETALKSYVTANLQAHEATKPLATIGAGQPATNGDFFHDISAGIGIGWESSATGLRSRGKTPDTILPEQADFAMRLATGISQWGSDVVPMVEGMVVGGAAGSEVPIIGNLAGAAAGAFAVPMALRKMYTDSYTRGDIMANANPAREFAVRTMRTAWEGIKGATTGAVSSLTAGVVNPLAANMIAPVAGPILGAASELATMTTVGSFLEGKLPKWQEFMDAGAMMGFLHLGMKATGVSGAGDQSLTSPVEKTKNIFAATGETPAQVVEAAKGDVVLQQQLIAGNAQEPPQAAPTELSHAVVKDPAPAEGEKAAVIGTKTDLVPSPPANLTPKVLPKFNTEGLSPEVIETLSNIGESDVGKAAGFKARFDDGFDSLYANNIDKTDPLARAMQDASEAGASFDGSNNPHFQARVFPAHMDFVRSILANGFQDPATPELRVPGLTETLKNMPEGSSREEYTALAMAKRALELDARPGEGTGPGGVRPYEVFNRETAQKVVDQLGAKYAAVDAARQAFGRQVIQYAVDRGLYSQESASAINEANKNYSPSARVQEFDEFSQSNGGQHGTVIKKIYGDDTKILDPIIQQYANTETIIRAAKINEVRLNAVNALGETGFIDKGDGAQAPEGGFWLRKVDQQGKIDSASQVALFRDGAREVYEGDPLLIDSLNRLDGDKTAMSAALKVASAAAKIQRFMITGNPITGIPFAILGHFPRNLQLAFVNSKSSNFLPAQMISSLGEYMGASSDTYRRWVEAGGMAGTYAQIDESNILKEGVFQSPADAKNMGTMWNSVTSLEGAGSAAKKLAGSVWHSAESFINITDNLSRFAEFKGLTEKGIPDLEAAFHARNVVTDYQMAGLQRSVLRTAVAFAGAHINSMANLATNIAENPSGTLTKLGVMSFLSAGVYYLQKDDEAIQAAMNYHKNTNWLINVSRFMPGYDPAKLATGEQHANIVAIPKPWAPGVLFGTGAEMAMSKFFDENPKSFSDFAAEFGKSLLPPMMPSIAQPVMDMYANKNAWSGRPLVPFYKQKLLPDQMYSPYTSPTAKALGKICGYIPLVNTLGPSTDPLCAPPVVENFVKTWGGSLGAYALKVSDWAGRGFTSDNRGLDPLSDNPYTHRIMARFPDFQDQRVDDFYKNVEAVTTAHNSYKAAAKAGDFAAAEAIQKAHPEMDANLKGIAASLKTSRATLDNIESNPNFSPQEKEQLMRGTLYQMGSMAKMGNEMMSDFRKIQVQNSAQGSK